MAKEKQLTGNNGNGTTLALADASASAVGLAVLGGGPADELAGIDFDQLNIEDDGLGEFTPDDIKLGVWAWNAKQTDKQGNPIPKNIFFNTLTEETARELDVVLIKLHKTNQWTEYNDEAARNEIRCSSFDQVTGTLDDGRQRPCLNCPDAKWQQLTDSKGKVKRGRKCGPVWMVYLVELSQLQPGLIKFRRTGLTPVQNHLNRYHYGQRKTRDKNGKIHFGNYPLYSFACKLTLRMSDSKEYAIPVLEKGQVVPLSLMQMGNDTALYVNSVLLKNLAKINEADAHIATVVESDGADGDTSFDTTKMGGGEGQDFTDTPAQ